MAALNFTLVPLHSSSQFPKETPLHPEIFCHACGLRSIPRPEGATAATRFTCRTCCDSLLISRDRTTAGLFAVMSAQIDRACWQEMTSAGPLGVTGG
jgi:hypothetical protein